MLHDLPASARHVAQLGVSASIAMLSVLAGCSTYRAQPGETVGRTVFGSAAAASAPTEGKTVLDFAAVRFAETLHASAVDAGNTDKALATLVAGRSLLNLRCNDYLDQIGIANQGASNERKQTDLVGGFAAAVMGLTGGSAKSIAAVASSFSFAGASMDSYSTTFLFSDAAKSINKIVREAQEAYVNKLNEGRGPQSYADAVEVLTGYEELCRPAKIRALIDEAIAGSKIVAKDPAVAKDEPRTKSPVAANGAADKPVNGKEKKPAPALFVRPSVQVQRMPGS